ncbi:TonB-dependent receptor [Sphingobacterium sp. lm-10]|uniref:SusC/RagA family TonB-linked outer membrane protein n=1 Tax=Sphingobacterium sp. lm-10 TaxID=2944904 RepID=UPI002021C82A|nr:TonB-dependent receptor [Sphingobacterium sp. lm-10]MCL7987967.1 TonB-dependent receptor [Sphingobacterium sp. lm-10]
MKRNLLTSLVMFALCIGSIYAQQRTIRGHVTSSIDRQPLAGVTVTVNGSSAATKTDKFGYYILSNVPADAQTLTFSFLGFNRINLEISQESVINVTLKSQESELSEVVVVGYGTLRRTDLTGSVSKIKGENFQDKAIPSLDKFLQGQAAGVQATTPSGVLGAGARVRIRGTNSISNSSDPLYVVDGVPYMSRNTGISTETNPLVDINPNDIASVEILKDGASTAIYGSRAANGVVLITTKRGQTGVPKLEYNNWFAAASPSKRFDLLNANEFIEVSNEKLRNANLAESAFPTPIPGQENQFYDTDWQNIVFRTGFQQNHALSLGGGTDKTNYFVSMGYTDMEGIIRPNHLRRFSLRTRIEQKTFNDKLTIGVNNSVSHTTNNSLNTSGNGTSSFIQGVIFAFPNVPARWSDGSYNLSDDQFTLGQGGNTRPVRGNVNQAFVIDNNIYQNQQLNLTGNAFAELNIIDGLSFRTQIGINYLLGEDYLYFDPRHGDGRSVNGRVAQYSLPRFRYNWHNLVTYNKILGNHNINAVIGQEMQMTTERFFAAAGTGLSSTYFGENANVITGTLNNQVVTGSASQNAFESLFGRAHYIYKKRYLISATLRNDRLSALPFGNQSATLPGASLGWNISEEDFFSSSFISDLKIRGSWAKVGNTEIGNYPFAGVFAGTIYGTANGIRYAQIANPDLRFETSQKMDVGIDVSFFNNRLSVVADYFNNNIDNLILAAPTPPSLGVPSNQINRNIGAMYNKGFEFAINSTNIDQANFIWRTNFNITFLKNRVQRLVDNQPINYLFHTVREGEAFGSFFGYVSHGVNSANGNPLFEKADGTIVQRAFGNNGAWSVYNPENGADESQVTDGLTLADKRVLGGSLPTWYGGLNNTFSYRNFDANIFLTFSGGNMVYNRTRQESLNQQGFAGAGRELLDRWTTPGQITDVPTLYFNSDNYALQAGNLNSRFLENGNFIRAQNISVGYNFTPEFLSSIRFNSLRIFAQVQNAFVITNYKGLDPELSNLNGANFLADDVQSRNIQYGLDFSANPIPRTYTFGLNVGF